MSLLERDTHLAQAIEHAEKAIAHYEALIAGDGITCADLVVFGSKLRDALRARNAARREFNTIPDQYQMEAA